MTFKYSIGRGGVEIRFSAKPAADIRAMLKANGFRWSPANGVWWRRRIAPVGDFLDALQRKLNPRKPDGACWRCQSPDGYFRPHGAATPVFCDTCHEANRRAEIRAVQSRDYDAEDQTDRGYEEQCRQACGA